MKQLKGVSLLPHREILVGDQGFLVPRFIRRVEAASYTGWRVDLGLSGSFRDGAKAKCFSDRDRLTGIKRRPDKSLQEACEYLESVYVAPIMQRRSPGPESVHGKLFGMTGISLKMRRRAYRSKQPGQWVVVVRGGNSKGAGSRHYIDVGDDGNVSQGMLISAITKALKLRTFLLDAEEAKRVKEFAKGKSISKKKPTSVS